LPWKQYNNGFCFDPLALVDAVLARDENLVNSLKQAGKHDINVPGYEYNYGYCTGTALHRETEKGNLESMKLLVQAGADVNLKDSMEFTALHFAAWKKNLKSVKLLV
jgi:ankyrin repeat protein